MKCILRIDNLLENVSVIISDTVRNETKPAKVKQKTGECHDVGERGVKLSFQK